MNYTKLSMIAAGIGVVLLLFSGGTALADIGQIIFGLGLAAVIIFTLLAKYAV